MSARVRGAARGQSLVLVVLLMLVVVMTTFLTFAIGARTRRKLQLQALADSTAYSLAVAEARAFNFYAWSNRALVAHHVSILSVHAHQSYLSFYEDMLGATGWNYENIARQMGPRCRAGLKAACEGQDIARRIRDIYWLSSFDPKDEFKQPRMCSRVKGRTVCRVDKDCTEGRTCLDQSDHARRGAIWFHEEWHQKDNSNSCLRMIEGSRDHFKKVQYLRSRQLTVDAQLRMMMTGREADAVLVDGGAGAERELLRVNTSMPHGSRRQEKMYERPPAQASLPQLMVHLTAPELTAEESAGRVSLGYYQRALDNGMTLERHRDYDEVLSSTRYPGFITRRGYKFGGATPTEADKDSNLLRLERGARHAAGRAALVETTLINHGTARYVSVLDGGAGGDPGLENVSGPAINERFPFTYSPVLPKGGRQLSARAHQARHGRGGELGDGDGLAAEDHGSVRSSFTLRSGQVFAHTTRIIPGRNGVWSDPHDHEPGRKDSSHSHHLFHGDLAMVNGHGEKLGDCTGPGCGRNLQRGYYRGHMRFRLARLGRDVELWNMPRTLTLISRPVRERAAGSMEEARMPWDFDFRAELPGPVQFTTWKSPGDEATQGRMAAFAGGLVYFHKPRVRGGGDVDEEYGEPPNLWNPFWRAKLHPVKQADALAAAQGSHPATHAVLEELQRWSALNY
ncbi:hypothetical protein NVS55_29915 [Myxococcus stipitatus]|uniref:hypothetical protein n=1 Tax=Myxococcus stipitatus TaxID=83455 RepID=UPI003144DFBE